MRKVIERTADYTIYQDEFAGNKILFRYWNNDPSGVDVKFNNAYAKANGYASTDEMIAQTIGEQKKQEMIAMCGYFPEWVRHRADGQVYFVAPKLQVIGKAFIN